MLGLHDLTSQSRCVVQNVEELSNISWVGVAEKLLVKTLGQRE